MPTPEYLEPLQALYSGKASIDPSRLTADDKRSLAYFRADVALREQPNRNATLRDRVSVWIWNAQVIDRFVTDHGDIPRRNNRLAKIIEEPEVVRLSMWLEDQRRPAARFRHCEYQRLRLDAYPGLDRRSRDQRWLDALNGYAEFLNANGRAPAARSVDADERALALWATSQRRVYHRGVMLPDREQGLRSLLVWAWGASRSGQ